MALIHQHKQAVQRNLRLRQIVFKQSTVQTPVMCWCICHTILITGQALSMSLFLTVIIVMYLLIILETFLLTKRGKRCLTTLIKYNFYMQCLH